MGIFPDAQGELTPQSLVRSLVQDVMDVLITCKNEEDPIKMKALEWSHDYPHYNSMGAICCHGNQSSDPIWPTTKCSLSPIPMMLQLKFIAIGSLVAGIFVFESVHTHTDTLMDGWTDASSTGIVLR